MLIFPELCERVLNVWEQHCTISTLRYVCMNRGKLKPGKFAPHCVLWGSAGGGKSFMLKIIADTICPGMYEGFAFIRKFTLPRVRSVLPKIPD